MFYYERLLNYIILKELSESEILPLIFNEDGE
jgi:hypothetical protein